MSHDKASRTATVARMWSDAENEIDRLTELNVLLVDAIESLLNIEGAAKTGGHFGAYKGLDVDYHFNKARTALQLAKDQQ
jgi:hypothetical protein